MRALPPNPTIHLTFTPVACPACGQVPAWTRCPRDVQLYLAGHPMTCNWCIVATFYFDSNEKGEQCD